MNYVQQFLYVVRELALAMAIAILVPFLAHYTAVLIYPKPEKSQFQPEEYKQQEAEKQRLEKKLARLNRDYEKAKDIAVQPQQVQELQKINNELDQLSDIIETEDKTIEDQYKKAVIPFEKTYFFIVLCFAIAMFGISAVVSIISINIGCLIAGFICYFMAFTDYWQYMNPFFKLLALLIALVLVVLLIVRFVKDQTR